MVLAAAALLAVFGGPLAFALLVAVSAAILMHEWRRITGGGGDLRHLLATAAVLGAVGLAASGLAAWGLALIAAAAAASAAARRAAPGWPELGIAWIGVPCLALAWLRTLGAGELAVLFLMLCVWATDIGAFFVGRAVGGPRLAPRISPNKTWAGLFGAMAASGLVAVLFARATAPTRQAAGMALAGIALALVAQAGDLAESWVKRRFGTKDSGNLIPGHGGLFDRVDGLLAAGCALALAAAAQGGRL